MRAQNDVCAVVVTYNRLEKLKKCIDNIVHQDYSCDVIVVDNNSTDGTENYIQTVYGNSDVVCYLNTGINLGGAGGFEYGIKAACKRGYKYLWIMDDDTWPSNNALSKLLEVDKKLNGEWGFLSSVAYWTGGGICKANIQKKSVFRFAGGDDYKRSYTRVQFASFVSLLIKVSVVYDIGLPIGEYFIWTDDYEYTGRISNKYNGYMVPGSIVEHAMTIHSKANISKDSIDRIDRYRYLYRNDVHCYKQQGIAGWLYILLKNIYMAISVVIRSQEKRMRLKVIVCGFFEGCKFRPSVNFLDEEMQ